MRLIRATSRFFLGASTHGPGEEPFEVDDHRAAELVRQGLAEFVVVIDFPPSMIGVAMVPAPANAEQAVSRRHRQRARPGKSSSQ